MIRILVVDDQPEIRRGLRMSLALEPDFEVVGEAQNGAEALALVAALRPDVMILDLHIPDMDGMAVVELVRARQPGCMILALSIYDDAHTQARAGCRRRRVSVQTGIAGAVERSDSPRRRRWCLWSNG